MIIDVAELLKMPEFNGQLEAVLKRKLQAIESAIRAYTNNNFQNRLVRFEAPSVGKTLFGCSPYLKKGDTVQITESVNDGLYVVETVEIDKTTVDKDLFLVDRNLVTKVEYPPAVVNGALNLMLWEVENREKVGVQSETISRHSVTYFNVNADSSEMGYPKLLIGFLKPYMKARF